MDSPHVSIIVPIYKVERYLNHCIQSLVEQTYYNIEIILVDDGSPDNCPKICDEWAKREKRIRVIHKKNGGLSDARNAGVKAAIGEYIVFVDSDDWVSKEYVRYLYNAMKCTSADICECGILRTTEENLEIIDVEEDAPVCYDNKTALKLLIQDYIFHQYATCKIYKAVCLDGIDFIKDKQNEDEFWTYRVFGEAKKVSKIEAKLYYYYQRNESIMGVAYNIKRLDALEAKWERQKYIDEKYPTLSGVARSNFIQSCIYNGQMAVMKMKGAEYDKAINIISSYFKSATIGIKELPGSLKQKIWIYLGKINFVYTCKLRNRLKIGF